MKLKAATETIAAIATPPGEGGVAVIRVSGANAVEVMTPLFSGKQSLQDLPSHTVILGDLIDKDGGVLDSVLITVFRAPRSYTGETVVEISCHGGYYISHRILDTVIANGARHAHPGEFTERAYLNGKLDLSQAEAVADLIHARSEISRKASIDQLHGRLGERVRELRSDLLDLCSLLELELDFSEEDLRLSGRSDVANRLAAARQSMQAMSDSFVSGRLAREGVRTVLAGKPNTGKSSLLNILIQENRAIVSEIPGTTRDAIEESLSISGMLFRLVDTAGLRKTDDEIEKEGIRRTEYHLDRADLILYMLDTSKELDPGDVAFVRELQNSHTGNASVVIVVLNKSDISLPEWNVEKAFSGIPTAQISCKDHRGIEALKGLMSKTVLPNHDPASKSPMILSSRHRAALDRAISSIRLAEESINRGLSYEFVAVDLHETMNALGEIIGLTTPEDVLQNIFSQFCIGK